MIAVESNDALSFASAREWSVLNDAGFSRCNAQPAPCTQMRPSRRLHSEGAPGSAAETT
jgi:hypothetical protein